MHFSFSLKGLARVLCFCTLAVLGLACTDGLPTRALHPPSDAALVMQAPVTITEDGCTRLRVVLVGRTGIAVTGDSTSVCGPIRPIVVGAAAFDRTEKKLRLPIALVNLGDRTVKAPARLYSWEDSMRVVSPAGLAGNRHTKGYLEYLSPDSAIASGAERYANAVVWRFDDALSDDGQGQLLAGVA